MDKSFNEYRDELIETVKKQTLASHDEQSAGDAKKKLVKLLLMQQIQFPASDAEHLRASLLRNIITPKRN